MKTRDSFWAKSNRNKEHSRFSPPAKEAPALHLPDCPSTGVDVRSSASLPAYRSSALLARPPTAEPYFQFIYSWFFPFPRFKQIGPIRGLCSPFPSGASRGFFLAFPFSSFKKGCLFSCPRVAFFYLISENMTCFASPSPHT